MYEFKFLNIVSNSTLTSLSFYLHFPINTRCDISLLWIS